MSPWSQSQHQRHRYNTGKQLQKCGVPHSGSILIKKKHKEHITKAVLVHALDKFLHALSLPAAGRPVIIFGCSSDEHTDCPQKVLL